MKMFYKKIWVKPAAENVPVRLPWARNQVITEAVEVDASPDILRLISLGDLVAVEKEY
jgi:hypothetical protein